MIASLAALAAMVVGFVLVRNGIRASGNHTRTITSIKKVNSYEYEIAVDVDGVSKRFRGRGMWRDRETGLWVDNYKLEQFLTGKVLVYEWNQEERDK